MVSEKKFFKYSNDPKATKRTFEDNINGNGNLIMGIHIHHNQKIPNSRSERYVDRPYVTMIQTFFNNLEREITEEVDNKNIKFVSIHATMMTYPFVLNQNGFPDQQKAAYVRYQIMKIEKLMHKIPRVIGFVIHLPNEPITTIKTVMPFLFNRNQSRFPILLEPPIIKDAKYIYNTPEKLAELINYLGYPPNKIKLCIDTAHLWVMGEEIQTYEAANAWIQRLLNLINPEYIGLIHFNGCSTPKYHWADVHELPTCKEDLIWGKPEFHGKKGGYYAFKEFGKKYNIPLLVE